MYKRQAVTSANVTTEKLANDTANWNRGQAASRMSQWIDPVSYTHLTPISRPRQSPVKPESSTAAGTLLITWLASAEEIKVL